MARCTRLAVRLKKWLGFSIESNFAGASFDLAAALDGAAGKPGSSCGYKGCVPPIMGFAKTFRTSTKAFWIFVL